jgi:hypothetical protein
MSEYITTFASQAISQHENKIGTAMKEIDRYFFDERAKAYLIGQLVRDLEKMPKHKRCLLKPLVDYIYREHLGDYFEGKKLPSIKEPNSYNWVIVMFATLSFTLGVVRFSVSYVDVGMSNLYNIPIVREGGLPFLTGIMLFIVAYTRFRYLSKRKQHLFKIHNQSRGKSA